MEPQLIRDRDGRPVYAVLPIDEYERLLEAAEDLEDAAAFEAARHEETFPAELVDRLHEGENRVRLFREHRGLKQRELAARIGISQSHLSDIEIGRSQGSLRVMAAIARALEIDLDLLAPRET